MRSNFCLKTVDVCQVFLKKLILGNVQSPYGEFLKYLSRENQQFSKFFRQMEGVDVTSHGHPLIYATVDIIL